MLMMTVTDGGLELYPLLHEQATMPRLTMMVKCLIMMMMMLMMTVTDEIESLGSGLLVA